MIYEFDDIPLEVHVDLESHATIRGARSSLGVPEEPDYVTGDYVIKYVSLFGIDLSSNFDLRRRFDAESGELDNHIVEVFENLLGGK